MIPRLLIKNNWLTLQGDRIQLNMRKNFKQLCLNVEHNILEGNEFLVAGDIQVFDHFLEMFAIVTCGLVAKITIYVPSNCGSLWLGMKIGKVRSPGGKTKLKV